MKKYFVIAAFAFAALVSCQKEMVNEEVIPAPVPDNYIGYTLTASTGDQTRSTLDGKSVVWAVGDKVAVYADGAGNAIEFEVAEVSASSVMFTGNAPADASGFVAVYPFDSAMGISDGIVKVLIPSEQVIPEGGDIDPTAMPSAAVFETVSSKPTFYNLMSLVKFNVGENEYVDEVRIGTDGEICLAGEIDAKVYAAAEPDVINNCDESIVIKSEVPLLPNKDYYAVVAPAEGVTGFNAGGVSGSRQTLRSAAEAVTFKRNAGLNLGDITKDAKWLYRYISNADDLKGFLAGAADYPEGWLVEVLEEIQLLGDSIPAIEVAEEEPGLTAAAPIYKGDFDGCGFSINGWNSDGVALFGVASGTIKNLTIASNCTLTNSQPGFFGFIARDLEGRMENCVNKADLVCQSTLEKHVVGMLAGHLASAEACMIDCVNEGNIEYTFTIDPAEKRGTQYIGGIVGVVGVKCDNLRLQGCINKGNIHVAGDNGGNTEAGTLSSVYVGGVAAGTGVNNGSADVTKGYTANYGVISDCYNTGDISAEWNGGTGGYFRVGGIIAYAECFLDSCENEGEISFQNSTEVVNAGPAVGGIAAVVAGTAPVAADNCVNRGDIKFDGLFANAANAYASGCAGVNASAVGGCFGNVGDNATLVQNCTNYGAITANGLMPVSNKSVQGYGGVAGYSYADVVNCFNHAPLTVISRAYTANVGGIVAYCYGNVDACENDGEIVANLDIHELTNKADATANVAGIVPYPATGSQYVRNCINKADVTVNDVATQLRLGGIIGIAYQDVIDCTNSGNLTSSYIKDLNIAGYAGGIIGYYNLAKAKISGCENSGSVTVNLENNKGGTYIAGLVGRFTKTEIDMENCTNSGNVSAYAAGTATTNINIAGAIGRIESTSNVTGVINNGDIYQASDFAPRIAGICGYVQKVINVTMKDCVNNGDIIFKDVEGAAPSGYAYLAGMTGYFGTPQKDAVMTYDGCINNGTIKCDLTDLAWCSRAGGIAAIGGGSNAHEDNFINCENHGDVILPGTTAGKVIAGGIISYSESQSTVTCDGCVNDGKMIVGGGGWAGGIQGSSGGTNKNSIYKNCVVGSATEISYNPGGEEVGGIGLFIGGNQDYSNAPTAKIAGTLIKDGVSVVATADNYQDMIFGKGNLNIDISGIEFGN